MTVSTTFLLVSSLIAGAYAVPTPFVNPMGINSTLIMESTQRSCNEQDTNCQWSFTINVSGHRTACTFDVVASHNVGAKYSDNTGKNCGNYVVASSWSGQFGENHGFSTLSVTNYPENTVAWPAYRDDQLEGGVVVVPDQSYPMQMII